MTTDLATHIDEIRVIDTHEHLWREPKWLAEGPDDPLKMLFGSYVPSDLITAGIDPQALENLQKGDPDQLEQRWAAVEDVWQVIRFTGFGEAVGLLASHLLGMDTITAEGLRAA